MYCKTAILCVIFLKQVPLFILRTAMLSHNFFCFVFIFSLPFFLLPCGSNLFIFRQSQQGFEQYYLPLGVKKSREVCYSNINCMHRLVWYDRLFLPSERKIDGYQKSFWSRFLNYPALAYQAIYFLGDTVIYDCRANISYLDKNVAKQFCIQNKYICGSDNCGRTDINICHNCYRPVSFN